MGQINIDGSAAFRDYATDRVQSSGPNNPAKSDIRALIAEIDAALTTLTNALSTAGAVVYATKATLLADLLHGAGTLGFVYNDTVNNGIYAKSGASGTGTWTFTGISFQFPITTASLATDVIVSPSTSTPSTCVAATTGPLSGYTYSNGTAGVGATLTATANGTFPAQDGVTLTVGQILLVKNSGAGSRKNNGPYALTQVGDSTHPAILTRVSGADTPAGLSGVIARVSGGSTQAGNDYYCPLTAGEIVIGTTSLPFLRAN